MTPEDLVNVPTTPGIYGRAVRYAAKPVDEWFELRHVELDGLTEWLWPKADIYAFANPVVDWADIRKLVMAHRRGDRGVIQAGGCCGIYPRLWAQCFMGGIYTFEPNPVNFHCLVRNCRVGRIFAFQAFLSHYAGHCSMMTASDENAGAHKMVDENGLFPVLRLDDMLFPPIDLIQLSFPCCKFAFM